MGVEKPKQYLPLLGRPLIHRTLSVLCKAWQIERVYVVLSVGDESWNLHDWSDLGPKLCPLFCGGPTRSDSVANGLRAISHEIGPQDWILVHDAARPCLAQWHIDQLISEVAADETGGLLAIPAADTLKRADSRQRSIETVPRDSLWQAQTPQMFRYFMLRRALDHARGVTDEASAIEAVGGHPKLVRCDATNLKVTYPFDLTLAEWILRSRDEPV